MAKIDIIMPQMGESITTGTITKWHKVVGEIIDLDEILLEISTDKVESEIPSSVKGKVVEILFKEGDTVDVGKKIAAIDDDLNASVAAPTTAVKPTAAPLATVSTSNDRPTVSAVAVQHIAEESERRFYTPLVRALAKEAGVALSELSTVQGTGAGGRVNRADFELFLKTRGTGAAVATVAPSSAKSNQNPAASSGRVEIISMDNMRKAIAKNMVASKLTSPHVNSISEVDLTHLVKFREKVKNDFAKSEGFNLTYTPFVAYAIIQALRQYPLVNSSVDGDNIVIKKDINLGFAVAVPGNGLVVPVVKKADTLNLVGLARAINQLANQARNKKLTLDDLSGGTFTYTNVGSFGTLLATPIILQPQVGIYASGVIQKRVVVLPPDDAIAVRSMMYGTHTYDHRIIDGELGGKFLEAVHQNLKTMDPASLL